MNGKDLYPIVGLIKDDIPDVNPLTAIFPVVCPIFKSISKNTESPPLASKKEM
jgi:hypothetical protein